MVYLLFIAIQSSFFTITTVKSERDIRLITVEREALSASLDIIFTNLNSAVVTLRSL